MTKEEDPGNQRHGTRGCGKISGKLQLALDVKRQYVPFHEMLLHDRHILIVGLVVLVDY
jgi:hypothetical protein